MTSSILFAGQEDISFTPSTAFTTTQASSGGGAPIGSWSIDTTHTTAGWRSGYARYCLTGQGAFGNPATVSNTYIRNAISFNSGTFWTSVRVNTGNANSALATQIPFRWADSTGAVRLQILLAGSTVPDSFHVQTVNGASAVTVGSLSTAVILSGNGTTNPDKLDFYINYSTTGTFTVYRNGIQIFTYSGDITAASGLTSLSYVDFGQIAINGTNGSTGYTMLSEMIVATRDTRNMSLATQVATANGNTHGWDGGTAANCAATSYTTSDVSPQYSGTAAQIQEYQVTPAMPTGTFSVISLVQHGRVTVGSTGPQHIEFMVRTGSSDFTSSSMAAPSAWGTLSYNWDTNPNTSVPWQTTDLAASSSSFNYGFESVT